MHARAESAISKSKFIAGVQCLKRLHFQVHDPAPATRKKLDDSRLEQGREVGLLARAAFPGGVLVAEEGWEVREALARTAALVEDVSVPAIFEGTFRSGGVLVRVDVLQRQPDNQWRLIEVKSSAQAKERYAYDVAIQHHVLLACGLDVSSANIMHINTDYVYDGHEYDLDQLFRTADFTTEISKLDVPSILKEQFAVLAGFDAPDVQPGDQCSSPYECEFFTRCNAATPENHVSFLPNLSRKKRQALLDLDIDLITDIPEDFPLTPMQGRIRDVVQTGLTWFGPELESELAGLVYPLYFMDFESLNPAIPKFAGTRPYSQLPFQWSVHRQAEPWADLEHFEFLATDSGDPRPAFVGSLFDVLGGHGHIVAYNASFEATRLGEIAEWFPSYADRIAQVQARLWDLLPVVRSHIYHPAFNGSFSLKSVLPALVPDLTYQGMEVANGTDAGVAWSRLIQGDLSEIEKERLTVALLAYCKQDTWAMVRILEQLRRLAIKVSRGGASG